MFPNGEYRTPETLALLKAMGLEDGLTDLLLILPGGRVRWIEVKLARTFHHGRTELDRAQIEMHTELCYLDHIVDVVRGVDDLLAIIDQEQVPHRLIAVPPRQDHFNLQRRRT